MSECIKTVEIMLIRAITFNGDMYSRALIDLDHINYGLNSSTKELNCTKRSDFTAFDIGQFLLELDEVEDLPVKVEDQTAYFSLVIECPLFGIHMGKKFRIVFKTNMENPELISTITLYRLRK